MTYKNVPNLFLRSKDVVVRWSEAIACIGAGKAGTQEEVSLQ